MADVNFGHLRQSEELCRAAFAFAGRGSDRVVNKAARIVRADDEPARLKILRKRSGIVRNAIAFVNEDGPDLRVWIQIGKRPIGKKD